MSKTWLLFDNGNYYEVTCSIYPPTPGSPRPADAFIVSESEGDFTIAARNAAHAAFTRLKARGEKITPHTAGIELIGRINAQANIGGESGGLSFALAFSGALLNTDLPDIAATGVVTADGTIQGVTGLATKLKTAATLVNKNGVIFYPKDNEEDISEGLCLLFKQKHIRCHAVNHLDEVFSLLLPSQHPPRKFTKPLVLIFGLILAGLIGYYFLMQTDSILVPLKIEVPRTEVVKPVPVPNIPETPLPKPPVKNVTAKPVPAKPVSVNQVPLESVPTDGRGFD